ncbi:hypothetical protein POM88_024559 [Heracleum sosnowskyi]|uniref:Uncharacterized protein n=1 Tax=Heracleum sosnowskyi TaxID=360622 RepID=A0AAD8I5C6_9APIA|nr:hypothetical protein POM88_024559 [Heracleum sosnowskyi]
MSSSIQSKRKRDDALPTEETTDAMQIPVSEDISCEEVPAQPKKNKHAGSAQTPIERVTEERQYLTAANKQKAEYWKDFKTYLSKEGARRAECKFCSITYVADPNNNETNLGDEETSIIRPPQESDWELVRKLVVFLEKFFILTNNVSASLSVTSNSALFDIGTALETLKGNRGNHPSCNIN